MNDLTTSESSLLIPRDGVPRDKADYRRQYQKKLAIYIILACTALERLAFYSLVINLVIILQLSKLHWDPGNSITLSFIFSGISYLSTFIFAGWSDAKFGRFKTIIIGFIMYFTGYIFVNLISNSDTQQVLCNGPSVNNSTDVTSLINEPCFGPIIGTLILTALGVGAIQANMAVFGAEQSKEPSRYFDKYVIATNVGGIFATLLVSYIQNVQSETNEYESFHGYLLAGSSLATSFLLFVVGKRFYLRIKPHDTLITTCIPVIINAFQTRKKHKDNKRVTVNFSRSPSATNFAVESKNNYEKQLITDNDKIPSFLDYARAGNGGKFINRVVNDVKTLGRVIVVFFLLIPYWLIYYQTQTTFLLQGQQMRIPYVSNGTDSQGPAIWMLVGDQASTIIGIVFLNLFVYKYLNDYNQSSLIQIKFIIGMILGAVTMLIAGSVEIFRQNACSGPNHSKLSIFTQLPQYIIMGLSEVFAMVASYEFAYLAAPRSAQSLIMSLRFCSLGVASFIGDIYVRIFTEADERFDFNCRDTEEAWYIYFYVLGSIQIFMIIIFIVCNRRFGMLQLSTEKINQKQFI